MKSTFAFACIAGALLMGDLASADETDPLVFSIGDTGMTRSEFTRELRDRHSTFPSEPALLDSLVRASAEEHLRRAIIERHARSQVWGDSTGLQEWIAARRRSTLAEAMRQAIRDTVVFPEERARAMFATLDEDLVAQMVSGPDETVIRNVLKDIRGGEPVVSVLAKHRGEDVDALPVRRFQFSATHDWEVFQIASALEIGQWSDLFEVPGGYGIVYLEARLPRVREHDEHELSDYLESLTLSRAGQRVIEYERDELLGRQQPTFDEASLGILAEILGRHTADLRVAIDSLRAAGLTEDRVKQYATLTPPVPRETRERALVTFAAGAPVYTLGHYMQDFRKQAPQQRPLGNPTEALRANIDAQIGGWLFAAEAERQGLDRNDPTVVRKLARAEAWEYVSRYYYYSIEAEHVATDAQLREYFDENPDVFRNQVKYKVLYYRSKLREAAEWALEGVRRGESPESLAAQVELRDPEMDWWNGQDWMGSLGTDINPTIEAMSVGESVLLTVPSGNHYVLKLLETRLSTFEDAIVDGIANVVNQKLRDEELDKRVARLRVEYDAKLHDAVLESVVRELRP